MPSRRRSGFFRNAALLAAAIFACVQFVRPNLDAAPAAGPTNTSATVSQILRTACYNCHSSETKLAWFDQIVPAYWLVVSDVKRARGRLDFSHFDQLPATQQKRILYEAINQVQLGAMPPRDYQILHPESRITAEQLDAWKQYLISISPELAPATGHQPAPEGAHSTATVRPSPNGIAFPTDYKDWQPIGSTERFDNHSLRLILGNEVTVRAIDERRTNPWPDGAKFAKVAWEELPDAEGNLRTGRFIQVELMTKDAKQYAGTKGWGWARWKGMDLQPYGGSAAFTNECVGCHMPVRNNDFVFTSPRPLPQDPALPAHVQWRAISSGVNVNDGTAYTLVGNPAGVAAAANGAYGPGSVLALATWSQQADSRWFGARVPSRLLSVESVTWDSDRKSWIYRKLTGTPLREETPGPGQSGKRLDFILAQRRDLMP